MSALYEHRDEFRERNPFLQVALGLISAAREVERVLPRLPEGQEPKGEPEPVLCFLLGIASVSRTILAHAAAVPPPASAASDRPASDTRIEIRSLLAL